MSNLEDCLADTRQALADTQMALTHQTGVQAGGGGGGGEVLNTPDGFLGWGGGGGEESLNTPKQWAGTGGGVPSVERGKPTCVQCSAIDPLAWPHALAWAFLAP